MNRPARTPRSPLTPTRRRLRAALLAPCAGALCSSALWAQTSVPGVPAPADPAPAEAAAPAGAAKAAREPDRLETVTVTATRRREPIREVPLRVETLGADNLERAGATSLSDYVGTLPGVDVKTDGGPGRGQVSIRGVTVGEQQIATVGVYVDDVAFGSSSAFVRGAVSALDMALLDLNHIELLRGPQGTLYGAGAMGGLLKYVTNDPDSYAFSGKVSLGVRGTSEGALGHTESAVLNVPLSEDVAGLRVAAFNDHDGGYVKATGLAAGDHVNDGDTRGARVSLLLEPMSKMRLRLAATGENIERNGTGYVEYDAATGRPVYGDLTRGLATPEPYEMKTRLLSADLEYDFGWARLNAIASTQRLDSRDTLDASAILGVPDFAFAELDNTVSLRKETQELRLTSSRGTVEWLLGAYHDKETGNVDQRLWAALAADGTELTLVTTGQPSTYRETAFYGDLTYNFNPEWSLTAGARVARNRQTYGALTNGVLAFTSNAHDSSDTYLATLRYAMDKTTSVYFRAASGYRPGGPNSPAIDEHGQPIPDAPTSFEPDSLWSYELGYKADLLDRRLSLEAAAYHIDWDNLQQPIVYGASTLVGNAGRATVDGLELAARYKADAQWQFDGSLAYTDAKLSEDAPALGPAGSRLPNTAKLAVSLSARYGFELGGHPSYASLGWRHVGQRNAGYEAPGSSLPNFSLPAYNLFDAQWGVEIGRWQLSTFVRNLTDQRALLGADTALVAFGNPLRATPVQPRTIGATLSLGF
ncbi:MAG: TonB-dependent receptor [Burkholderiaceae bacterium]